MADSVELCEELTHTFGVPTNKITAIDDEMSVATVLYSKGHCMILYRNDLRYSNSIWNFISFR